MLYGGNMYYLIVYDVTVEKVNKLHRFLKKYMNWIQNSVFEGEIGDADIITIKKYIKEKIDSETDSVLLFSVRDKKYLDKEVIGRERNSTERLI